MQVHNPNSFFWHVYQAGKNNMTTSKPKLLLHFDINKTLIISDSAGGKTVQDICTTILMQSTWGTICEEPQNVPENSMLMCIFFLFFLAPDHFKVFFRWKPFTTSELSVTQLGSNTYNFDEFMEKEVYPYPKLDTLQAQLEANKQVKDKRRQIIKVWYHNREIYIVMVGMVWPTFTRIRICWF